MVTKGTLTPKEFEEQKKRLLASSYPVPTQAPVIDTAPTALSMTDLDKQLRLLAELYQNSTINSLERDDKKRQLLAKPIVLIDMKADLEMVSALFQQSMINNIERDELKRKLLQMEPVGK